MMQGRSITSRIFHMSAAIAAMTAAGGHSAMADEVLPTTPQGVTLVEVMRELPISQPEILWVRLGDSLGRTLFIYDQDDAVISRCTGECATEFPPLVASGDAKAFGDWSLLHRDDESRQWAGEKCGEENARAGSGHATLDQTRPRRRRKPHSAPMSANIRKKRNGISHSAICSTSVTPAPVILISSGSVATSSGV